MILKFQFSLNNESLISTISIPRETISLITIEYFPIKMHSIQYVRMYVDVCISIYIVII